MNQMAQLMDHQIVDDAVRGLDDVPVEQQPALAVAGTPASLSVLACDHGSIVARKAWVFQRLLDCKQAPMIKNPSATRNGFAGASEFLHN